MSNNDHQVLCHCYFYQRCYFGMSLEFVALSFCFLCLSLHKAFSILMKNGRRLSELSFFSMDATDSILLRQATSASTSGSTEVHSLSAILFVICVLLNYWVSLFFHFHSRHCPIHHQLVLLIKFHTLHQVECHQQLLLTFSEHPLEGLFLPLTSWL